MKVSVVIPTYNEEENIEDALKGVIRNLKGLDHEIIVIDDSTDRTADIIRSMKQKNVRVIKREGKLGLGSAYKLGFSEAVGDVVFSMDADGSHDPVYFKDFIMRIQENRVVIGSRYVAGGKRNDPFLRKIFPKIGSLAYKVLLRSKVLDVTSGYRLYSKESLQRIDLGKFPDDFSFQTALLLELSKKGVEFEEIPIKFHERVGGEPKYSSKDFIGNLKVLLKNIWKR
jgi:dolichol-phosphate mannosyltransferase